MFDNASEIELRNDYIIKTAPQITVFSRLRNISALFRNLPAPVYPLIPKSVSKERNRAAPFTCVVNMDSWIDLISYVPPLPAAVHIEASATTQRYTATNPLDEIYASPIAIVETTQSWNEPKVAWNVASADFLTTLSSHVGMSICTSELLHHEQKPSPRK